MESSLFLYLQYLRPLRPKSIPVPGFKGRHGEEVNDNKGTSFVVIKEIFPFLMNRYDHGDQQGRVSQVLLTSVFPTLAWYTVWYTVWYTG